MPGTVQKKARIADLDDPDEIPRRRGENCVRTKAYREAKKPENAGESIESEEVQGTQVSWVGHETAKPAVQRSACPVCGEKPRTWLQRYLAAHPEHRRVHVGMDLTYIYWYAKCATLQARGDQGRRGSHEFLNRGRDRGALVCALQLNEASMGDTGILPQKQRPSFESGDSATPTQKTQRTERSEPVLWRLSRGRRQGIK